MTMKSVLTSLLILLMMIILVPTAQAQAEGMPKVSEEAPLITSPTWTANFGKQTALQLRSKNEAIREQALINLIMIANHPRHNVNLRPAISGLQRIYERGRREEYRLMALVALHAIGDADSMSYLAEQVQHWERSDRVRKLTYAILADYYFGVGA